MYAFLSYTETWPDFNHQQTEVQEILEVPLSVIRDLPKPPLTMELPRTNGYKVLILISKTTKFGAPLL